MMQPIKILFKIFVSIGLVTVMATQSLAGGNGKDKPYDLSLLALRNADNSVDVQISVALNEAFLDSYNVPTLATHIQLKSFDLEGKLGWTKNYQDQPLIAGGDGQSIYVGDGQSASVTSNYTDMQYRQLIKAQVQVKDDYTASMKVLRNSTEVLLAPDPGVSAIQSPTEVKIDTNFDLMVTINEYNKDIGASFDLVIYDGAIELARMPGARADPAGPTVLNFTGLSLSSLGEHTLRAAIENVDPHDYDTSNNSEDFMVTVTEDSVNVAAQLEFYHHGLNLYREWDNAYSKRTEEQDYINYEYTTLTIWSGDAYYGVEAGNFAFPLDLEYSLNVDGTIFATDQISGIIKTDSYYNYYDIFSDYLGNGQYIQVVEYKDYYSGFYRDIALFQNYVSYNYYEVRMTDTDGDGVLEVSYEYTYNPTNATSLLSAGQQIPSSIMGTMKVTSAGVDYAASIELTGSDLPNSSRTWETETGTRGVDYYKQINTYRYVNAYKYQTP